MDPLSQALDSLSTGLQSSLSNRRSATHPCTTLGGLCRVWVRPERNKLLTITPRISLSFRQIILGYGAPCELGRLISLPIWDGHYCIGSFQRPGRRCVGERKTPSDGRVKSSESQLYSSIKRITINWKLMMLLPQFHSSSCPPTSRTSKLEMLPWFKHFTMLVFLFRFYTTCTRSCQSWHIGHDVVSVEVLFYFFVRHHSSFVSSN